MNENQLLELFEDKLPTGLGKPCIIATKSKPYIFCAFYNAKAHELVDGRVIRGNEFRLWQPSSGFAKNEVLAGVFGVEDGGLDLVCCALTNLGTTAKDIAPFGQKIREMMTDIVNGRIDDW